MFGNRLDKLFCYVGGCFFVYIIVYVVFVYYACLLCADKFFGLSSILIIADFNIINMFILIVSFYKCCLLMLLKAVAFFDICLFVISCDLYNYDCDIFI